MRYLRYLFLALLAAGLVTIAVANRDLVTLRLFTDDLGDLVGLQNSLILPLYVVIFAAIVVGIVVGFIWEWLREYAQRAQASALRRDKDQLERQINRLQDGSGAQKDDVLALLEEPG